MASKVSEQHNADAFQLPQHYIRNALTGIKQRRKTFPPVEQEVEVKKLKQDDEVTTNNDQFSYEKYVSKALSYLEHLNDTVAAQDEILTSLHKSLPSIQSLQQVDDDDKQPKPQSSITAPQSTLNSPQVPVISTSTSVVNHVTDTGQQNNTGHHQFTAIFRSLSIPATSHQQQQPVTQQHDDKCHTPGEHPSAVRLQQATGSYESNRPQTVAGSHQNEDGKFHQKPATTPGVPQSPLQQPTTALHQLLLQQRTSQPVAGSNQSPLQQFITQRGDESHQDTASTGEYPSPLQQIATPVPQSPLLQQPATLRDDNSLQQPTTPVPQSPLQQPATQRDDKKQRFLKTQEALKNSGLLEVTMKTAQLINQQQIIDREIQQLKVDTSQFIQLMSGDETTINDSQQYVL